MSNLQPTFLCQICALEPKFYSQEVGVSEYQNFLSPTFQGLSGLKFAESSLHPTFPSQTCAPEPKFYLW